MLAENAVDVLDAVRMMKAIATKAANLADSDMLKDKTRFFVVKGEFTDGVGCVLFGGR